MVIEEDSDDEPLPIGGSSERAEAVAAAKEPTVAAAPAPSARKEPTAAAISAYQRSRASGVKARVFPLDKLPASNTISTGRTIKPISGWHGMWPPIREFFQNTIDHLDLRKEGGLHPALTRSVSRDAAGRTRIAFRCGGELVCLVVCSADQLLIAQAHTFPLHPRALDTGVDDTSKGGDATAGGFGDGFKTGIVALLALPHSACRAIRWDMLGGGRHVSWQFVGARRDAVGTFAKSTVLEVHATNQAVSPGAASAGAASGGGGGFAPDIEAVAVVRGPGGFGSLDNIMVQTYDVKGIGTAFLQEAVPRLVVFWRLDTSKALATKRGELLAEASSQPTCFAGEGSAALAARPPEPGVYIRGIWVRKPPLEGALMCFLGRLNVSGRDRNDVDQDELAEATLHLMHDCQPQAMLSSLLEPLRSSAKVPTWLTKSPRFLNRLLEADRDFFVHDVLRVPRGALFVSKRTTDSKHPFIRWASDFLEANGAPVFPLEPKANKILFSEVSEAELEDACVKILLSSASRAADDADPMHVVVRDCVNKMLKFVNGKVKVHFSRDVTVAFVSGAHCFVPAQPLTRSLAIRVLGVVQRKLGAYNEAFTHLQQGLFEAVAGPADRHLNAADVDAAIKRAKQCSDEAKAFLGGRNPSGSAADKGDKGGKGKKLEAASLPPPVDADDDEEVQEVDATGAPTGGRERGVGAGSSRGGGSAQSSKAALAAQIARALRERGGAAGDLIPSSAFAADGAGSAEECLKPTATLQRVRASASCGGGEIYCDDKSAALLRDGTLPPAKRAALLLVRSAVVTAKAAVGRALPELRKILSESVSEGYDDSAGGKEYLGFCTQRSIILNLAPLLSRANGHDTTHELVLTVCHEVGHLLERGGAHGPEWRATYDRLVQAVLHVAAPSWTAAGMPKCACAQCE